MPSLEATIFTVPDGSCRVWYCRVEPARRRELSQVLRRHLLASQLSALGPVPVAPQSLAFSASLGAKPRLLPGAGGGLNATAFPDLDFSVAYGPNSLAIAIQQGGCIGVDTTPIDLAFAYDSVVDAFFTAAEAAYIAAAEPAQRAGRFARLWTRKEAYLKATGTGIAGLDQRLDVVAACLAGPPCLHFHDLDLGVAAEAALCVATDHDYDTFTMSRQVLTLA